MPKSYPSPATPANPGDFYATAWKIVDSLDGQGLYKSALEQSEVIAARAKSDKNDGQAIKALIFRGKYTTMLEEDGLVKAVVAFEKENESAQQPQRAVLQSLLAEMYATYLQNQGWRIQQRTPTPDDASGDILTWSGEQLERRALTLYSQSLQPIDLLRQTPSDYLREVSIAGRLDSVSSPLRPTLFDFLAHRALAYFSNERSYLTEPAYKFYLEQEEAFAPAEAFAKANFASQDSTSGKWLAIKTFQKVIDAHRTAKEPSALIDADLIRLEFAKNNSTLPDKNDRYLRALEMLHKQYYDHPSNSEIVHHMAQLFVELDANDTEGKQKYRQRAVTECTDAIRRHPNTYGAGLCQQLIDNIRRSSLGVQTEEVSLPQKPVLVSIEFQNLSKVWVKVVAVPSDPNYLMQENWEMRLQTYNKLPALQPNSWNLPDPGDYRQHRTEIRLEALPAGHYMLLVSDNENFDLGKGWVANAPFACSKLAIVTLSEVGSTKFYSVDRESGLPLAGVKAEIFRQEWNYSRNRSEPLRLTEAQSDADGRIAPGISTNEWLSARFSTDHDTLWISGFGTRERYSPTPTREVQIFTDRALYRPGQTIYFKGVLIDRDGNQMPKIATNQAVSVLLTDANGQQKGSLELRTNTYGTFNGAFTAPSGGLSGSMNISVTGVGGVNIQVEEYKRPKFEVLFKPLEGAYRLNDKVKVRGEAKMFAGSAVDGAALRYRVVRRPRFPFWDWCGYRIFPPYFNNEQEIANGTATTNADGSFEIVFTALPDKEVPEKDLPTFDYEVMADVTDITGETRSGSTNVSVAKIALQIDLGIGESIERDSLPFVALRATNLAGKPVAAKGLISLQPLREPAVFYKKRLWNTPDLFVMKKPDFQAFFPDMAWKDEDEPKNWEREDYRIPFEFDYTPPLLPLLPLLPTTEVVGDDDKLLVFNKNKAGKSVASVVEAGHYLLILQTQDAFGEKIRIERVIRVWDKNKPASRFLEPAATTDQSTLEPGQTASSWIGAKVTPLNVLFARDNNGILQNPRWTLVNGAHNFTLPVAESDRGGLYAVWFVVKNNRYYEGTQSFAVPYSNKELKITYETFRDKLAPGQQEEWRLKISGPQKEKVAAEMVATLYDASLDQFLPHNWSFYGFPTHYPLISTSANNFGLSNAAALNQAVQTLKSMEQRTYQSINWFGFPMYSAYGGRMMKAAARADAMAFESAPAPQAAGAAPKKDGAFDRETYADEAAESNGNVVAQKPAVPPPPAPPSVRRNLNETVFFFPELRTDAQGNVILKFKMNEALTRWKFMAFAHTPSLQYALTEKTVVTQKELMVLTNAPRFFRAGDEIVFAAKVSNLSQQTISGNATLTLMDAVSAQPVDQTLGLDNPATPFNVPAGQSAPVQWRLRIPADFTGAVTWQVFAEGGKFNDGEESTVPVVSNRMLVTETLPISVRGNQTKNFVFENLKSAGGKRTSQNFSLEFSSNPVWYAVQSLPYLMEYPHECSEQIFSRFYANTLASSVTEKLPNIRRVYDRWKNTGALKSNLAKNQELKYALLEETPWVMDAQSEEQQKQNIALLFDLNRMSDERQRALATLAERQLENGAWPWFPGGRGDWYITQYIVEGMRHLEKLGAFDPKNDQTTTQMLDKALGFCADKMQEQYRELEKAVKEGRAKWEDDHLEGMAIHFLYVRSFSPADRPDKITAYYLGQAEKYWLGKGLYQEGLLALALHRYGRPDAAQRIVNSLRERAQMKEELGMYWAFDWGMYWYQQPVETQALMVEVFDEVASDRKAVEELRIWLLKNKQTNRWESTKSTAEAVYALLLHGDNWLQDSKPVLVSIGGKPLKNNEYEPGTGYFKNSWKGSDVKPSWSDIRVQNPNSNIVWGAAYWQYFDDLDNIASFKKTGLTIVKQLFREENSPTGPKLTAIPNGTSLKVGDKLKVRIEIRADRPMEYVHLKDLRAAGFEPTNVLSGYRWQDGLGYYESTKDLATHFFIDYLPRGAFVFEYPLVVSLKGDFSNGIATMQCMYAPEFTSHSEGLRVKVE